MAQQASNDAKKAPSATLSPRSKKKANDNKLTNEWSKVNDNIMLLIGNVSQAHKKFRGHNLQGAAISMVAIAFAYLKKMNSWTKDTLDKIIQTGDNLYQKSRQIDTNKCREYLLPPNVYKYFYLGSIRVSMKVDVLVHKIELFKDEHIVNELESNLHAFLSIFPFGIFYTVERQYFTFWAYNKMFFLFDSTEHDNTGQKWTGVPGLGYSRLVRFPKLTQLVLTILQAVNLKHKNYFLIYPCKVENYVKVNTTPPETIDRIPPEPPGIPKEPQKISQKEAQKIPELKGEMGQGDQAPQHKKVEQKERKKESDALETKSPEEHKKPRVSHLKIPPERPRLQSVTNFKELKEGKFGILQGSTNQSDPKFSKYRGFQGFANALAALSMLRIRKSKQWLRSTVNQILQVGETIHHEVVSLPPGLIPKRIIIDNKSFKPNLKKHQGGVGQLVSTTDKILSLEQALSNHLIDYDCTILFTHPYILAIWKEENRYYLFDPNSCDENGIPAPNEIGVACVLWFTDLKDLVAKILSIIPPQLHKNQFTLPKISIEDAEEIAEDWNNFNGLSLQKWILRGTFSQNDRKFPEESRNSQCTANATMALAYKELTQEKDWNSAIVDQVLMSGDEFYRNCVAYLQEKNIYKHPHLLVDEVLRAFDLNDKRINLEIDDCLVNGVVNAKSDSDVPNLKKGFEEFFTNSEAGIVTANDQSMAVWKRDDAYYYYDSHSRDKYGITCAHGTACLLRLLNIDELTKMLMTNLHADSLNLYNISRIGVKILDITEDGVVKPPLNNYQLINDFVTILRANYNHKHPQFDLNAGKQTVPMCLTALLWNWMVPADSWKQEDVDDVLFLGNQLYTDSMEANYVAEDLPPEANVDQITTNNVKKTIKLGACLAQFEFEDYSQGNLEDNLKEAAETLEQRRTEEGNEVFGSIIESEYLTVSMWRDENLFYLFDPQPRDEQGQVYGKDDWSAKIEPEEEVEEENKEDVEEIEPDKDEDEEGGYEIPPEDVEETEKAETDYETQPQVEDDADLEAEEAKEGAGEEEVAAPVEKKGSAFWRAQEEGGKACVLRFSRLEDLLKHLLDNCPPNKRQETEYTWKIVKIIATPVLHEIQDAEKEDVPEVVEQEEEPEAAEKKEIVGNWHNFVETDRGKWILRSVTSMNSTIFLQTNRGRQEIPVCLIALVAASIWSMEQFTTSLLDTIVAYGDRLFTLLKRNRFAELLESKEIKLTEPEIEEILDNCHFDIVHYPMNVCMFEILVSWNLELGVVNGDITSTLEEVPNVASGLRTLFDKNKFGFLQCNEYSVAVWQSDDLFYMFDPHHCGPSGLRAPFGVSCITMFANLDDLADLYTKNLPTIGTHFFVIHSFITQHVGTCPRDVVFSGTTPKPVCLGGFTSVMLGKQILRGEIKHQPTSFSRGVNIHSAPVALVALALSLCKHPLTWTKIVIDEILRVGEDIYHTTVEKLGDKFNVWQDNLQLLQVGTDFNVGSLKVNWALRHKQQCGLVDVKNSKTLNLRQGLERFFEENSHGILIVQRLILAIWELEDHIYMYDPNSRGVTGLPTHGGYACVLKFTTAKVAADHVMACLVEEDKSGLMFMILPIEMVIGEMRSKRKKVSVGSVKKVEGPSPKPFKDKPLACTKKQMVLEQSRALRLVAEEERRAQEMKRIWSLGRAGMLKLNDNEFIVRGVTPLVEDTDLPVNYVAFCLLQTAENLDLWNYTYILLILESGKMLYIDSCVAYKLTATSLALPFILRTFFCMGHEIKLRLFKPLICNTFNKLNVLTMLDACFFHKPCFIFQYDDYLVTLYFKSGFYYLFDPYRRDLYGNKTADEDGSAMLMKFGTLEALVDKMVYNFIGIPDQQLMNFALLFLEFEYIKQL